MFCGLPVWSGALADLPATSAAWSRATGPTGGQEAFASVWGPWSVPGAPGQQRGQHGDTPGGQAHHVRRVCMIMGKRPGNLVIRQTGKPGRGDLSKPACRARRTRACTHIHEHAHTQAHVHSHTHSHTHTCTPMHTHACTHVCTQANARTWMHACVCTHPHTDVHTRVCTQTNTVHACTQRHTYTHRGTHKHMWVHTRAHIHEHAHRHMCTQTHMHAPIHTHMR